MSVFHLFYIVQMVPKRATHHSCSSKINIQVTTTKPKKNRRKFEQTNTTAHQTFTCSKSKIETPEKCEICSKLTSMPMMLF